ncbi:hypothetical protein PV08_00272 [Exophiala spinifera]|uniref:CPAF-like PDZ domain-containing protein n=1 Tax=Exophiala spinifera TaxID=91928 RepID=A0A0D2BL63_9EURO|nr:uncharacterized protein PV08_00272 [Exophiala spinifera]KIW19698.1 hypothetical protein PV08_00272 [Exophiala spinifera]
MPPVLPSGTCRHILQASSSEYILSAATNFTPATTVEIPAALAYECLKSIPNVQDPALRLINSLRTYLEFQSTIEYLQKPPSGFLFPPVDLHEELDKIEGNVLRGQYESEYDMQVDITSLLISTHDGHLSWQGDLLGVFQFLRGAVGNLGLVSVSSDGIETPQVYLASDLVSVNATVKKLQPVTNYTPSPVESIDGVDVVSFLLTQSMVGLSQDPDALWNQNFFQIGNQAVRNFVGPIYYPGPTTNVTFANGTTHQITNIAVVSLPLDGIATGEDAYSVFCPEALESATASAGGTAASTAPSTATSTAQATTTTEAPSSPTIPLYPYPVIKHSANSVAGYYLNDTGYTDVAVLQVRDFQAVGEDPLTYSMEFQAVVQKFLNAAVKTGKRKLIIDFQGNPGGHIDLGTDLFAQLFPSLPPNSKSNMRDHLGFWILGNVASSNITAAMQTPDGGEDELVSEVTYTPLAYQSVVADNLTGFPDFDSFYGPNELYGGNFSAFFQNNYTDASASDFGGTGIVITGTNNRTGFRQPFAPQDIVVLYDGYCASTCTVVSEYLKSLAGVQFVTVGGRPQSGPMQAVGGVKGTQVFEFLGNIDIWVTLWESPENTLLELANGTIWENFTFEPTLRSQAVTLGASSAGGVNGRNHFRFGDESETPLQFVYEAADCRLWWTKEMLYDPVFLWERVATVAFKERKGTQFNSKYCVSGSTGHPTSISGGWRNGTLGPQTPPANASASVDGWKLTGRPLGGGGDVGKGIGSTTGTGLKVENNAVTDAVDGTALASMKTACASYSGDKWLVKLVCNALGVKVD